MGIQINGNTNNINAGIGSLSIEDIHELDLTGIATASNFKTGVSNLHNVGLTLSGGQIDVGSNIKIGTAGVITATSFVGSGANLTGISGVSVANQADNRLITATGTTDALNGEANLTYDGTDLTVTGSNTKIIVDSRGSNGDQAHLQLLAKDASGNNNFGELEYDGDGDFSISSRGSGAANNSIVFKTTSSNVERLRIKGSNGQVSISNDGTTDGLLTIKGNSDQVSTPSIRLLDGSDTREVSISNTSGDFVASVHGNDNAIHGHIKMFESGIFDINNGGASGSNVNRLRIATDGNVHINMTDNGTASAKLNIEDSSSAGTNVLLISNKPSGANGKARMVFHTETSTGQGCSPYIQSVSGADAGPNANNNQNAGGFEFHTRSGGSGTDNNALRIRDDGSFEKYGANGNILLTNTGSDIEFSRGGRNRFSATHANGYFDFNTGGQYTFPAMRLFASPSASSGAKVGINTDSIGVDAQMSVMAPAGMPGLYTSYGMRIMSHPDGNQRISNATGIYAFTASIPANNTWTTVAIGRYHAATVTIRVGDAASKRVMVINYDLTQPAYGVATYNIITNNGNWNTGSSDFQISSSGSDYALQVRHNSYYNTSNNSGVYMNFNVC